MSSQHCYSADGRWLVALNGTTIRLYQTDRTQHGTNTAARLVHTYNEVDHLRYTYTSVQLHIAAVTPTLVGYIAASRSNGAVVLFDVASGEVHDQCRHHTEENTKSNNVTATSCSVSGTGEHLLCSWSDNTLSLFSVKRAKSKLKSTMLSSWKSGLERSSHNSNADAASTIATISHDGSICVLSSAGGARAWKLDTSGAAHRTIAKCTAHPSDTRCLQISSDNKYIVIGSTRERYISIWSAVGGKQRASAATLQLSSAPVSVEMQKDDNDDSYTLVALDAASKAYVWRFATSEILSGSAATSKPAVIVQPAATQTNDDAQAAPASRGRVRALQAEIGRKKTKQRTAAGNTLVDDESAANPQTERVVAVHLVDNNSLQTASTSEASTDPYAIWSETVLLPSTEAESQSTAVHLQAIVTQQATNDAGSTSPTLSGKRKRDEPETNGAVAVDVAPKTTAALQKTKDSQQSTKRQAASKVNTEALLFNLAKQLTAVDANNAVAPADLHAVTPKAGSLTTVLTQALHTRDEKSLDYCLTAGYNQPTILTRTIQRLPTRSVLPFIELLCDKLQRQPSTGAAVALWTRELIRVHVSYIISLPSTTLSPLLMKLHNAIELRATTTHKLIKLGGRLDMLVSQITAPQYKQQHTQRPGKKRAEGAVTYELDALSAMNGVSDDDESGSDADALDFESGEEDSDMEELDASDEMNGIEKKLTNGIAHSTDNEEEDGLSADDEVASDDE